jgi:ribosome-binding factor A
MANIRRNNRVASLIQSEIARLLVREIADPQLQGISITEVTISKDMMSAKVFFHPGMGNLKEIEKGIQRALPFFRRTLARNLNLRQVPELTFEQDTHTDELNRILGLLEKVAGNDPDSGAAQGA